MKLRIFIMFLIVSFFLFSQSALFERDIRLDIGDGKVDFTTYTIYADATADIISGGSMQSELQLVLQNAAEEQTIKTLYETLGTVPFDSYQSVSDVLEENSDLHSYLLGVVVNARLVGISYPTRTSIKVAMALDILATNRHDVMGAFIENVYSYHPNQPVTYYNPGIDYTSLVIDARGIGFNPSLFPTVYDEFGNIIYGVSFVRKDEASKLGFVRYSTNANLTEQKFLDLGKNPYRIVAWNVRGRLSGDLVIANEDASIIASSESLKTSLQSCKVVLIID